MKVVPCPLRSKALEFGGYVKDRVPPVKGFKSILHLRSDFHQWAIDSRQINASEDVSIHVIDPTNVVNVSSVGKEVLWHVWEEVSIDDRSEGKCVNQGSCSRRQKRSLLGAEKRHVWPGISHGSRNCQRNRLR